jgi:hypothetical protein
MKNPVLGNTGAVSPDAAIEQIRALRATLPEVATLTPKQRKMLRNSSQTAAPIVQSSLNVIGVSNVVSTAVGVPIEKVRALQQQAILWRAVEEEARNLVAGLAGANALRRDACPARHPCLRHRHAGGPRSGKRSPRVARRGDQADEADRAPQEAQEVGAERSASGHSGRRERGVTRA